MELSLPLRTIDQINEVIGQHMQAEARNRKGAAPASPTAAIGWLMNIGGLLSKWLPIFLNVLNELAAASTAEPTVAQFAKKLHETCPDAEGASSPLAAQP
jgi:hypothetical protein